MRTSVAADCCMICSGLHQRVIGESIDHMAWAACVRPDGQDFKHLLR